MNSIIEAQITLQEEQAKELERCKDPYYLFLNYWKVEQFYNSKENVVVNRKDITREMFEHIKQGELHARHRSRMQSAYERARKYSLLPEEAFKE